jgi:hypothetical protein
VAGEPGDLGLSGSELGGGVEGAFAYSLAGGKQLAGGALGESVGSHGGEGLVCGAQLGAGVGAPVLAAQPFAVKKVGPDQVHPDAGTP